MNIHHLAASGAAALALLAWAPAQADDNTRQSASARQSAKARDYATRQDKEGPPDIATASSADPAAQKPGEKMPVLDSPVVDKAAKDTGDNWKKMDKVLDRF